MSCRQCSVIHLFHFEYTVCRGFNLRLPQHSIVLSCDIHLCLLLYLFHTFPGDAVSPAHLYISSFSPLSPSCSPFSLSLPPSSLLSLCFSSHLPSPIFPSIFIPTPPSSLHPSLPLSLSPLSSLLSLSLRCALMNCLPLPVNSTDNPGEAVKDHRSALQTGPQATAQEQHANNKPLHLAPTVCIYELVRVCVHVHTFEHLMHADDMHDYITWDGDGLILVCLLVC